MTLPSFIIAKTLNPWAIWLAVCKECVQPLLNGFVKNHFIKRNKFTTLPVKSIETQGFTWSIVTGDMTPSPTFAAKRLEEAPAVPGSHVISIGYRGWLKVRIKKGKTIHQEHRFLKTLPKDYFNSTYISDILEGSGYVAEFLAYGLFFCNCKSFDSSRQICLRSRLSQAYRYHDRMSRISLSRKTLQQLYRSKRFIVQ